MKKKPNFLVFMTDQQRGDMQPPFTQALMPNLRRLYRHGISFTNSYCVSPHCCPSRASFFSGLYPTEHGVWNNVDVSNTLSRGLYDGVRLFPEDLRDAGYRLYYSGKWHVSAEEGPMDRGFEILYHHHAKYGKRPNCPDTDEWIWYKNGPVDQDGTQKTVPGQIVRPGYTPYTQYGIHDDYFRDDEVTEAAVRKIRTLKPGGDPFFMYVGTLGPHDPYFVPQKYLDMYKDVPIELPASFSDKMKDKPRLYVRTQRQYAQLSEEEHIESIRHYLAFCSYQDALFGKILDSLEEQGLLQDTYVIYVSDHGDYVGAHGLWAKGLPCFKEAYRICNVIGYGGITISEKNDTHDLNITDFAPTILDLAGIQTGRKMSGRSFAGLLNGKIPDSWPEEHYTQSNGNEVYGIQRAVFNHQWKYVFNSFDEDELYNLEDDPDEMINLAGNPEYRPVIHEMCMKMWQFAYDHSDNCINPYIMTALAPYGPGLLDVFQHP